MAYLDNDTQQDIHDPFKEFTRLHFSQDTVSRDQILLDFCSLKCCYNLSSTAFKIIIQCQRAKRRMKSNPHLRDIFKTEFTNT